MHEQQNEMFDKIQKEQLLRKGTDILEKKTIITELRHLIESNKADWLSMQRNSPWIRVVGHWKLLRQKRKRKIIQKIEDSYRNYGAQWNKTMFALWELQKEKKRRKEEKVYLKQNWLKTSQIWGEKHPDSWG